MQMFLIARLIVGSGSLVVDVVSVEVVVVRPTG
jgi:hypothetical protein